MMDKPIIFSAAMVKAILSGAKTQTRRVLKPQPQGHTAWQDDDTGKWWVSGHGEIGDTLLTLRWAPGDRLWVRETWSDQHPLAVQDGRYSQQGCAGIPGPPSVQYRTIYRADGEPLQVWRRQGHPYFTREQPLDPLDREYPTVVSNYTRDGKAIHWNPSIHMPRTASRITLAVDAVRVQRLHDISEEDAIAEGIRQQLTTGWFSVPGLNGAGTTARAGFAMLWGTIHGADAWNANPWVSATTIRRIEA